MGEISEIVDAILYLDSANFVTGEILHVDGGKSAGHHAINPLRKAIMTAIIECLPLVADNDVVLVAGASHWSRTADQCHVGAARLHGVCQGASR
jgi:hypothetical protein